MHNRLVKRETKLALIGLGYVGLPIALEFAKCVDVVGFDISEARLAKLRKGVDPGGEMSEAEFDGKSIVFTSSLEELKKASFFIVAVPTPIDRYNRPDLEAILGATRTVAKVLKKGDYVVYESTVYPGCTEEDCLPILEEISGLKAGRDFKVGYSPERINPGDHEHTLPNIMKIVSGMDTEALDTVAAVYELVIKAGIHRATNIKVAEAAKIIENTQRDINIALVNELSMIFNRIGINTYDVLEAAGTKWNFLKFYPGLVGGHCIGVDPYYLVHKARALKFHPRVINAGRYTNDAMGEYIAQKVVKEMISKGKYILGSRALVMGITFKENVKDVRNSKVVDIIKELKSFGVNVDIVDPYADPEEVQAYYGLKLTKELRNDYDTVIVAVSHEEYKGLNEDYFLKLTAQPAVIVDIKGMYRSKINKLSYWCL